MSRYYKKAKRRSKKNKYFRLIGFFMMAAGVCIILFLAFPLLSWYAYLAPSSDIELVAPVPSNFFASWIATAFDQENYNEAKNWFPEEETKNLPMAISSYTLSVPKLAITKAVVSTVDTRLSEHLVHYPGTALPSDPGTAVIFGHSTLPQFFNQKNYKTIFANLYKLRKGDTILVAIDNVAYTYLVDKISITGPDNKTIFAQRQNEKFLKLVTCTPPGTKWKRLVVRSKLQAIERI